MTDYNVYVNLTGPLNQPKQTQPATRIPGDSGQRTADFARAHPQPSFGRAVIALTMWSAWCGEALCFLVRRSTGGVRSSS